MRVSKLWPPKVAFGGFLSLLVAIGLSIAWIQRFPLDSWRILALGSAIGLFAALPLWMGLPKRMRWTLYRLVPGRPDSALNRTINQLYEDVNGTAGHGGFEKRREELFAAANNDKLRVLPVDVDDAFISRLDDVDELVTDFCQRQTGMDVSQWDADQRINRARRALQEDGVKSDPELADTIRDINDRDIDNNLVSQTADYVGSGGQRGDRLAETVKIAVKRLRERQQIVNALTTSDAVAESRGLDERSVWTERRTASVHSAIGDAINELDHVDEANGQLLTDLRDVLEGYDKALTQVDELQQPRKRAKELGEVFADIEAELDTAWIRQQVRLRAVDGGRERRFNSETKSETDDTPDLLRDAVNQGVVGERVAAWAAGNLLQENDYSGGTDERRLLLTISNDDPPRDTDVKDVLEESVETIRHHTVLLDSFDSDLSHADIEQVTTRIENLLDDTDHGVLESVVRDHVRRRTHSAEAAGDGNVVTPYVTYKHLQYLDDVLREISQQRESKRMETDSLEQKYSRIDRLRQQSNVRTGQVISNHFVTLADQFASEAKKEKGAGKSAESDALLYAADRLLDAVMELYETQDLREKLARIDQ